LTGASAQLGTLVLARSRGRRPFDDSDLEMASAFANQAAVAVELADARADQQRMTLLEDRDRIARTLHDQVIQRLFAAGLSVQGVAGSAADSADVEGHQQRLRRVVSDIDDTIRQIRTSVFELQAGSAGSARSRLLAAVADAEEALPATPSVIVDEGVELLAGSDPLLSDVVAVLREGLSNVARHAGASAVDVQVRIVDRSLVVEITDNGAGIGPSERRSGLENLRRRALARAGSMLVEPAPDATPERPGTRLTWTVPVA
jgi:signal transduction histidine kinase